MDLEEEAYGGGEMGMISCEEEGVSGEGMVLARGGRDVRGLRGKRLTSTRGIRAVNGGDRTRAWKSRRNITLARSAMRLSGTIRVRNNLYSSRVRSSVDIDMYHDTCMDHTPADQRIRRSLYPHLGYDPTTPPHPPIESPPRNPQSEGTPHAREHEREELHAGRYVA